MEITKTIETTEGTVEFTGILTGMELQAVIEVGLNTLLHHGALPFMADDDGIGRIVLPVAGEVQ
jgi:hypothetical protein